MRRCYKCKTLKPFSEFNKNKSKKSGYGDFCKSCLKIFRPKYDKTYSDKNREKHLLSTYKGSDKKKGLICDLSTLWLKENITSKSCIYCGDTDRIGCDRIDNSKGHTMDNVVPCCPICNLTRMNNYSFSEMQEIGNVIKKIKKARELSLSDL